MEESIHILLVEDHDSVSFGVKESLLQSEIECTVHSIFTADDAYAYIISVHVDVVLLDIVLKSERTEAILLNGDDLLRELRKLTSAPKIIMHSKIDGISMLDYVINSLHTDGYILKSRTSLREFPMAITQVLVEERYFSPSILEKLKKEDNYLDIDYTDRILLLALSRGAKQVQLSVHLSQKDITMTLSAIEKRIHKLKERFDTDTVVQLIAEAHKQGIIT